MIRTKHLVLFNLLFLFGALFNIGSTVPITVPAYVSPPEVKHKLGPVYIDIKECGAKGNGIADDTWAIQKAIDSSNKTRLWVYAPPGIYKITKTLQFINRLANGNYAQAHIKMMGEDTKHSPGVTIFRPTFKDAPLFAVHLNKGSIIKGIYLDGMYRSPNISLDSFYRSPMDTYGDSTCRDSRYSPYCAIAVDPYRYNLPPDGGYPTLQSFYGGQIAFSGSTGLTFEHLTLKNFTIGVIMSPNGYTLNNEITTFKDIRVNDCKFAFVGCQAQEKDNNLVSWEIWGKVRCAFVWGKYGQGQPGHYNITGFNIAGSVVQLLHRPSQGFFPLYIDKGFAESLGSIGYWNTSQADKMSNSTINFYYYKYIKQFPNDHMNGSRITFSDCSIRYYGQFHVPIIIKGFDNRFVNTDAFNYVNFVNIHRYNPSVPTTGFSMTRVAGTNSVTSLPLYYEEGNRKLWIPKESASGYNIYPAADSLKVGDFVVFYQGSNGDLRGMGEVTYVDSTGRRVEYISEGVPINTNTSMQVALYKSVDSTNSQTSINNN